MTEIQPEITVALPAYNEQDNIVQVLKESMAAIKAHFKSWEIIVIDNCSTDKTAELVQDFSKNHGDVVKLIRHDENKLYSGSCRSAMDAARGRYVAIVDSDGQYDCNDLGTFVKRLASGANIVFGWRHQRHDPFLRKVFSFVFNTMGRIYLEFPFHDLNCGMRVFDRRFINAVRITHRINMANPELYARALACGLQMDEVKINHMHRLHGQTSHNFSFVRLVKIFWLVKQYMQSLSSELKQRRIEHSQRQASTSGSLHGS